MSQAAIERRKKLLKSKKIFIPLIGPDFMVKVFSLVIQPEHERKYML